jgi:type I restriction enzyme S subunit
MRPIKLRELLDSWDAGAWGEPVADGVSVLRSTNFRSGGQLSFENQAVLAIDDVTLAKKRLAAGDILLERSGGGPLQPVGRVAGFWESEAQSQFICGNFISRLVPKKDLADSLYLMYTLLYWHMSGKTEKFQTATTGIRNLQMKQYLDNELSLPEDVDQQRQIAARLKAQLAEVETARQAAQVQLRDARLLRARMLKAFFAELDTAPKKRLGENAPTTSGSTPSRGNMQYWQPAEIAWVKTGEVAFAPITATEEAISKLALAECSLRLLPPKSVLIAMIGQGKTRGQSAMLEIPATTNQNCFAVMPNDTWEPDFLYLWMKSSYQDLRDLSSDRGGNQSALNGTLLNALEVPAPSKPEQLRLVARIQAAMTELDAMEQSCKEALADIEKLPARILAQAFEN